MTDLTQYSEKVRNIYDMKNNPTKVKDTYYKKYSSYSGEEGVSEGHSQSWFHCSFGEQGRIMSYFAIVWLVCVIMIRQAGPGDDMTANITLGSRNVQELLIIRI